MSEVRTLLKTGTNSSHSPKAILENLNDQLLEDLSRTELFITMFYAKYNAETGVLSYANAGHNHPVLQRAGNDAPRELDAEGLILGVKNGIVFEERIDHLASGDVLFFYTDGLTEASNSNGDMFGTTGLYDHLGSVLHLPANEIIDSFYARIHQFTGSQDLQDDISLVVVKIL
jgi:sigma-B regulation protein RsbU (phosphoserine phosphatase)